MAKTGYPSIDRNHEDYYGQRVASNPLPEGLTIYDYLFELNKHRLSLPAISYIENSISYREFFENCNTVAKSLDSLGVKKGDFVTAVVPTMPEAFYIFLGASRLGAAVSFVDPRYGEGAIEAKINATKSDLVIAFDGIAKTFNRRSKQFNTHSIVDKVLSAIGETAATKVVYIPMTTSVAKMPIPAPEPNFISSSVSGTSVISWEQFLALGNENEVSYPTFQSNMPVAVVSTGGSTGTPKSAVLTNENIIRATFQVKITGLFPEEARWYDIMPPSIAYGLADGSVLGFSLGNEVRLNPDPTAMSQTKPTQLQMVEDFVRFDPHSITCAPNHVFAILDSDEWLSNPHSLVNFVIGGDSLNPNQVMRANEVLKGLKRPESFDKERFFGQDEDRVTLNTGYGSTEVTGAASVSPRNNRVKFGTVGLTLPYQAVSAFSYDESTNSYRELEYVKLDELDCVPEDKVGEFCIEGPNVMQGYLNNPEETAKAIKTHPDGKRWVHTGDLGYVDEEGYLHYVDRIKYISVGSDGFKVAPVEIEEVILHKDAIDQCKAVIFDDPEAERGSLIKVFYTLKKDASIPDASIFEDELNEYAHLSWPTTNAP